MFAIPQFCPRWLDSRTNFRSQSKIRCRRVPPFSCISLSTARLCFCKSSHPFTKPYLHFAPFLPGNLLSFLDGSWRSQEFKNVLRMVICDVLSWCQSQGPSSPQNRKCLSTGDARVSAPSPISPLKCFPHERLKQLLCVRTTGATEQQRSWQDTEPERQAYRVNSDS